MPATQRLRMRKLESTTACNNIHNIEGWLLMRRKEDYTSLFRIEELEQDDLSGKQLILGGEELD